MAIRLKLDGFDDLLNRIQKAGGTIDSAVDQTMKKSADIMQSELKSQMAKTGVSSSLINRMPPPSVKWENNSCSAKVGYKKGEYDPNNLSDGYKAVFLNYGTPRRARSQIKARHFIKAAKKKATPQIKRQQKETLEEILKELN